MAAAVAMLCVAAAACSAFGSDNPDVSNNAFPADYLNDKVAVAYLSTQIDAKTPRGHVVFIKGDGTTEVFDHEGLDVGRLAHDGRTSVLVPDRKTDTVIGAGTGSTSRARTEDVGFFAAWVPQMNGYLSLFNSGPQDNAEGYGFNIYWHDRTGNHTGNIPYYLEVAGICDGDLYTVSSPNLPELVTKKAPIANLLRTRTATTATTDVVASWPDTATTQGTPVGQIFCHAGKAYFMFQSSVAADDTTTPWGLYLTSVDLRSGQVSHRVVRTFAGRDEAGKSQTWFSYRSTYLNNGVMHYLDGQGRVYSTDLATGRVRQDVVLGIPHYQDGMAVTHWSGTHLCFLYQSHDLDKAAVLTCYDYTTGARIWERKIEGFGKLIGDGVSLKDLIAFDQ